MKKTGVFAFTLAEVLITLGIIGVVCAITIPTLINNSNDAQTKAGVKEAYSILSQAMTTVTNDNGGTIAGICSDWNDICFKNLMKPALSYVKECDSTPFTNGCWVSSKNWDNSPDTTRDAYSVLILKNGMLIKFRWHHKDCDYTDGNSSNFKCGWAGVDINGFKGPNIWGKDIFIFGAQDGRFLPGGLSGDTGNFLNCTGSETGDYSGYGCASKYLNN